MGWLSGTFSRVRDWTEDAAAGENIEASFMDAEDDNFATGINACRHKGGQNAATANLPMGGFIHTGVGDGSERNHYSAIGQVQDNEFCYGTVGGTVDVITLTLAPAITAYSTGQVFWFKAAGDNTGAVTINVNGVGAKTVQYNGAALAAGYLVSGTIYAIVYDGTYFQVVNSAGVFATKSGVQDMSYSYAAAGGTATALTLTLAPAVTAYAAGQMFVFKASATNTGASTIDVNGLGAKIIRLGGAALNYGEIENGNIYVIVYNGTQFDLISHNNNYTYATDARLGGDQTIADSTDTALSFGSTQYDYGNLWEIGSPTRITIPAAGTGVYLISALVNFDPDADGFRIISLRVNGSTHDRVQEFNPDTTASAYLNLTVQKALTAADYVELYVYHEAGNNLDVAQTNTKLQVSLIRRA